MNIPKIEWKKDKTNKAGKDLIIYFGTVTDIVLFQIENYWWIKGPKYHLTITLPYKQINFIKEERRLQINSLPETYDFKSIKKCKEVAQSYLENWLKEILGEYNNGS